MGEMQLFKEVVVIFRGKIRRKRLLGRLVNDMLHIPGYLVQRFGKIDVPAERFGEPFDAGGEFMIAGIEDNDGSIADQGKNGPVVAVRDYQPGSGRNNQRWNGVFSFCPQ